MSAVHCGETRTVVPQVRRRAEVQHWHRIRRLALPKCPPPLTPPRRHQSLTIDRVAVTFSPWWTKPEQSNSSAGMDGRTEAASLSSAYTTCPPGGGTTCERPADVDASAGLTCTACTKSRH